MPHTDIEHVIKPFFFSWVKAPIEWCKMANNIRSIAHHREKDFNFQIGKNNDGTLVEKF